jgi:phage repressor protein C with HTH and peptisase S24 domain
MLRHPDIWNAIDALARRHGLSPSGLARRSGLDSTTFNKSKRITREGKPRWPSTGSIAKILDATGSSLTEFLEPLIGTVPTAAPRIPVLPYAQAIAPGRFDEDGRPSGPVWGETTMPDITDADAFALEIGGRDLEPAYRNGDVVVLSPAAPIEPGCRLLVRTWGGEMLLMQLLRHAPDRIELQPLAGAQPIRTLAAGDVQWMARIVLVRQ